MSLHDDALRRARAPPKAAKPVAVLTCPEAATHWKNGFSGCRGLVECGKLKLALQLHLSAFGMQQSSCKDKASAGGRYDLSPLAFTTTRNVPVILLFL